jgi:hypothetical protein
MADPLRDMEATLAEHSGDGSAGNGLVGLVSLDPFGPEWYSRLTAKDASTLVGVSFANTTSPIESRGRAVVCAFFVVKARGDAASKHKFRNIALCPRHFEFRPDERVRRPHGYARRPRPRLSARMCDPRHRGE